MVSVVEGAGPSGSGAASGSGAQGSSEPTDAELEAALLGQDAEDVELWRRERDAAAADAAEFDESIPFGDEVAADAEGAEGGDADSEPRAGTGAEALSVSGNESDLLVTSRRRGASAARSRLGAAASTAITDAEDARDFGEVEVGADSSVLAQLESALSPVQRYMLRVLEESQQTEAAEAERELEWEEWEMERLARKREEEERLADEEDEVLFYTVPEVTKHDRKRGRGAKEAGAPSYLSNVAQYLQQQLARSGLEESAELTSLEMQLWGPPVRFQF